MITDIQAEDEVFGIANSAWLAAIVGIDLTYVPAIYFPDAIVSTPDPTQIYAECDLKIVLSKQASLCRYQGQSFSDNIGLLSIQIYSPKQSGSSLRVAKIIGATIKNAFCKPSPSGYIWFQGQRITPVAGNATRNQVNVVVTCTYRTIQ